MKSSRPPRLNAALTAMVWVATAACYTARAADKPSLKVFYTASVKGYIDECGCRYNPTGGIERRATFLERNTDPSVPTLMLDAGDVLGNDDEVGRMQTRYLFRGMKEMGYRVLGVGPRDFLYGIEFLRQTEREFGFIFTSANVLDDATGRPVFVPYVVEELAGRARSGRSTGAIRVGLVSVMGLDRAPQTSATDPTVRLMDPVAAARGIVSQLRGQTDVIVVMAYTSQADIDTIRALDGVDVVISARPLTIPNEWVTFSNGRAVAYSSFQGRGVGWIDLRLRGAHEVTGARGDLAMMSADIPDNARMIALKREFEEWRARTTGGAQ